MDSKFIAIGAAAVVVIVALVAVVGLGMGSNSNDDGKNCITYNGNGGSYDGKTVVKGSDSNTNVLGNVFSYDGHKFVSWNTAKDGSGTSYSPGSKAELGTTLYAQWTEIKPALVGTVNATSITSVYLGSTSDESYAARSLSGLVYETLPADAVILIMGDKSIGDYTPSYIDNHAYITYESKGSYYSITLEGADVTVKVTSGGVGYVITPTSNTVSISTSSGTVNKVLYYINDGSSDTPVSDGSTTVKTAADLGFSSTYEFVKWNTKADGSGTDFKPGDKVPYGIRLYAMWAQ